MSKQTTPDAFTQWVVREMPAGTEIGDPEWWAPRLWRAAESARKDVATPAPDAVTLPERVETSFVELVRQMVGLYHAYAVPEAEYLCVCDDVKTLRAEIAAALEKEREAREAAERAANENKRHYEVAFSHVQNERRRADSAEARVRELEAALNDALAEMEAGDAPDMRWLPANPSSLFGMVSNRYRSVYAILDAALATQHQEPTT